jgi:hypothetical protein
MTTKDRLRLQDDQRETSENERERRGGKGDIYGERGSQDECVCVPNCNASGPCGSSWTAWYSTDRFYEMKTRKADFCPFHSDYWYIRPATWTADSP